MREDNAFDFPCSYTFRAYEAELNEGIHLPGIELPEQQVSPPVEKWHDSQWDRLQQLEAEVIGWRTKHAEVLKEIDQLKKLLSKKKGYKY